jgi:hypothetical protein
MAMGTRKQREKQEDIWIAHRELPSAMIWPFIPELKVRQAAQLLVDQRQERIESLAVSAPPLL